jgi:hypothetical protein
MTARDDDQDLRARFRALYQKEASVAPAFARPQARALRPRRRPVLAAAAAIAAVGLAAAGYAWWTRPAPAAPFPIDLSTVTWIGPTDFLLDTPGAALLRDVPALGIGDVDAGTPFVPDDTARRNRT